MEAWHLFLKVYTYLQFEVFILVLQEKIPIEEVFEQLKCTREGLSADEGVNRLQIFGPNKLEEKKVHFVCAFVQHAFL